MPVNKKQLVRLVRLVAQLKENRYPNCASFAADMRKADIEENLNLSCTPKTIARDIQVLKRDFNAPIDFDPSRNGYYLTHHEWTFSCPQIFDDSCMLSAVLGARVAEHIFPHPMRTQIRDAVNFLLTNNNPDFLDTAQVDSLVVIPSNRSKIDAKVFMPLFYAWQNHEVCHIAYWDSKGKATERDFEPHALVFFDGVWYTKVFCHVRKETRTLVASRMKSVVPTGRFFEPDPKIIKTVNEDELFDYESVRDVVVHCDDYLAKIVSVRPLHSDQEIIPLADGGCELQVKEMLKFRLQTWIMHQCGRAILLSPQECINELFDFATKIMTSHSKGLR